MTNFAALDQTRLRDMLQAVLDVLLDAADGAGWTPADSAVTLMQPGYGCDAVYVWPQSVGPTPDPQLPCAVVATVTVRWAIALCVGADAEETGDWWAERVAELDRVWGVVGGLYAAIVDKTLVRALNAAAGVGTDCMSVRVGRADRFDSADVFVWEGSLAVDLPT